ncbi:MAG TPA: lysylphosphatidylglycerol synthase transmembrane domain-containing protein [Longimicrobiales bacterium]|nr:lysylphosphatidylglycerol synthase transmembrane domain-containing protein [Longimicrobiales bacterium]
MASRTGNLSRYLKPVSVSVAVTVGLYLAAILLTDGAEVVARLRSLPAGFLALAVALPTLAFLFRFLRWDVYLRALGHALPPARHLQIYLGGFALTATPGKVGENLRALYLRPWGVPMSHSVAAFTAERLGDLVAMLLLSGLAFGLVGEYRWVLAASVVVTLAGLLVVRHPGVAAALQSRADPSRVTGRVLAATGRALGAAGALLTPRLLGAGVAVALLAWGAEALTFALVAREVGIGVPVVTGMGIFAVATLLGAVSFLPGGVGATEAVMAALLVVAGGTLPEAAAAILIIRVVTLWWAVLLGVLAVLGLGAPPLEQNLRPGESQG